MTMAPKAEDLATTTAAETSEFVTSASKESTTGEAPAATEETTEVVTMSDAKETLAAEAEDKDDKEKDVAAEAPAVTEETVDAEAADKTSDITEQFACFDLSTIACCGLGSKGACAQCETPILYSEESVAAEGEPGTFLHKSCHEKMELEKLENVKATQIQTVARAKFARETVQKMITEKKMISVVEAKSKETTTDAAPEAAPEQAPVKKGQKTFFQKLSGLFTGCRKSDKQVVEQPKELTEEKVVKEDKEQVDDVSLVERA